MPTVNDLGKEIIIYLSKTGNLGQINLETTAGGSNLTLERQSSGSVAWNYIPALASTINLYNGTYTSIADANWTGTNSGSLWDNQIRAQRVLHCICTHDNVGTGSFIYVWQIRSECV